MEEALLQSSEKTKKQKNKKKQNKTNVGKKNQRVQILDKAVCICFHVNTQRKGLN